MNWRENSTQDINQGSHRPLSLALAVRELHHNHYNYIACQYNINLMCASTILKSRSKQCVYSDLEQVTCSISTCM